MKVRLSEGAVELVPESLFERDALHHLKFHGILAMRLHDPQKTSVLELTLNPARLHVAGFNEATRQNSLENA